MYVELQNSLQIIAIYTTEILIINLKSMLYYPKMKFLLWIYLITRARWDFPKISWDDNYI